MMYSAVHDLVLFIQRSNCISVHLMQAVMSVVKCKIFMFLQVTPFHSLLNITLLYTSSKQLSSTIRTPQPLPALHLKD